MDLLGPLGVTEGNLMTYMGIIEQRINELLQANAYIQQQKQYDSEEETSNVKFERVNLSGFLNTSHNQPKIIKFGFGAGEKALDHIEREDEDDDDDEDEDEDAKPMGVEEFKARAMGGGGKMR
jgi:hypothetical protein